MSDANEIEFGNQASSVRFQDEIGQLKNKEGEPVLEVNNDQQIFLAQTPEPQVYIDTFIDDDTMAVASATSLATSESIKAYVDAGGDGSLNGDTLAVNTSTLVANLAGYTGQVGIGTATPASPNGNATCLEIAGTSVGLVLDSTNGGAGNWEIQHNGGDLKFQREAVNAATFDTNGNLGLGTTGPDRKLDILDDTNPQLRLTQADGSKFVDLKADASGRLNVQGEAVDTMVVRSSHNNSNIYIIGDDDSYDKVLNDGPTMVVGVTNSTRTGRLRMEGATTKLQLGVTGAQTAIEIDASENATFIANLSAKGNVTLGDADTDAHELNGTLNLNKAPVDETCSGITATFQAGEGVNRGDVVYFKPADSKMYKADANAAATSRAVAMAAEDIVLDGTGRFLMQGFVKDTGTFAGAYAAGDVLYTSGTAGPPTKTAPSGSGDFVQIIGWAVDADTCFIQFDATIVEIA